MKALLLPPLTVLLAALAGVALCKSMGRHVHLPPVLTAAGITAVAGILALIPRMLADSSDHASLVQAALLGTGIHLLASIMGAAVVFFGIGAGIIFTCWMLAFYWASLLPVAGSYVRSVRAVTPKITAGQPAAAGPVGNRE